jgi:hypothetical protein
MIYEILKRKLRYDSIEAELSVNDLKKLAKISDSKIIMEKLIVGQLQRILTASILKIQE